MVTLIFVVLVFLIVSVIFLFIHLLMGKFIRPANPEADKLTIYECGEPTIGSAWIQFDLRYYVIALLFVIFDVEVAFFFPWAVVFGKANTLAMNLPAEQREQVSSTLVPKLPAASSSEAELAKKPVERDAARSLAWIAFWDILIFFGVLLVGFAYLWKRGDIDWVRSTAAERVAASEPAPTAARPVENVLVGSGQNL